MRQEKQFLLDEIAENIEGSEAFILARYGAMNAEKTGAFRDDLAKAGAVMQVVRKRVLGKAMAHCGIDGINVEELEGSLAVVFAKEDPIVTTKEVFNFCKNNEGVLEVVAGRFDGQMYGKEDVTALSKLPGKDEMRAQFLGLLEAPMSQTLSVMQALLTSVIYCLDNKVKAESAEN